MSLNMITGVRNEAGQNTAAAITELQGLTFSGPLAGASADTAITVTGIETEDTIKKVINMTDLTEVDLGTVTIVDRRATGTLTLTGIVAGDVVGVNGKNYTAVANPGYNGALAPRQFVVGATDAATATSLAKAIMSSDSTLYASAASDVVTIIYRTAGTGGNSIALAVTGSNSHAARSGATLAGGTATSAIKIGSDTSSKKLLVVWYNKN